MDFFDLYNVELAEEELGRISRIIHLQESHDEMEEMSKWPAPYDEDVCAEYFLRTESDRTIRIIKEKIAEETLSKYWKVHCQTFSGLAELIGHFPSLHMAAHINNGNGTALITVGELGSVEYKDGKLIPNFCPRKNGELAEEMVKNKEKTVFVYNGKPYYVVDVAIVW